jgi:hypothetical protein
VIGSDEPDFFFTQFLSNFSLSLSLSLSLSHPGYINSQCNLSPRYKEEKSFLITQYIKELHSP